MLHSTQTVTFPFSNYPAPGATATAGLRRNQSAYTTSHVEQAIIVLRAIGRTLPRPLDERESDALSVIYRAYSGMLRTVARRLVHSSSDAEDVVHDVFTRVPWVIHQYRDGGLGGWLKQMAAREALMRQRQALGRREEPLDAQETDLPNVNAVDRSSDELRWAVAQLPLPVREVVVLRVFLECSHREIAELLDCSVAASEVRFCRAITQMRLLLHGRLDRCFTHRRELATPNATRNESIVTRRAS